MTLRHCLHLLREQDGIHYGGQIFLGTFGLWFLSRMLGFAPLWAIISLILVTEVSMETTWRGFKCRIINTLVGCLTGLVFLVALKPGSLLLPLALATAVCISVYLIRIPYGWRIAAITAAIVIIPSLAGDSKIVGLTVACQRTMEVFMGSAMAVLVTWLITALRNLSARTRSRIQLAAF